MQDMNPIEERLAEEVRRHQNLYVTNLSTYKDTQMANNSWSEISKAVDLSVPECIKRWRSLRDKFVRLRKKMTSSSGDAGGEKKVPKIYIFLSWLMPHIKHRETSSNYDVKEQNSQGTDNGTEFAADGPVDCRSTPTPSQPMATTTLSALKTPPTPSPPHTKSTHDDDQYPASHNLHSPTCRHSRLHATPTSHLPVGSLPDNTISSVAQGTEKAEGAAGGQLCEGMGGVEGESGDDPKAAGDARGWHHSIYQDNW